MINFLKKHKMSLIKIAVIILILGLLTLYVTVKLLSNRFIYVPRTPYDQTGFVKVDAFDEEHIFIVQNDRFKLELNASDTKFVLTDDLTSEKWHSNPQISVGVYPKDYNDLFVIYYERLLEAPKSVSVFDKSIKTKEYLFKEIDKGLEILYMVGREVDITLKDLPKEISGENFEQLILAPLKELAKTDSSLRRNVMILEEYYQTYNKGESHRLSDVTTPDAINLLYNLIFNLSDYTEEHMIEDSRRYNIPLDLTIPYFEFVVRYEIIDTGLKVTIINESIFEEEEFQIAYIDVLPYFGSNTAADTGFTIIPDGSGILIDHQQGNTLSPTYDKRIYGSDASIGSKDIMPETQQVVSMPMYGYTKNDNGFINVLESSDTMASIRAGFKTNASVVPFVYYRYMIRERDGFIFESQSSYGSQQRVTVWTKDYNTEDFVSNYIFGDNTNTYYELAKLYQNYLVEKYELEKHTSDEIMHITVLGGYKQKKHFLGFPYDSVQSLTNAAEVKLIVDELELQGLPLNLSYLGWSNEGIRPTLMNKITFDSRVASKKDIVKLKEQLEQENIKLMLEFFTQTAYTDKRLKPKKEVTKNIFQKPNVYYQYDEATQLRDRRTMPYYRLGADLQASVYENINKIDYIDSVILNDEAKQIATEFYNKETKFRNKVVENVLDNLSGINKEITLRNPNIYGSVMVDNIIDTPNSGARNVIVSYDIPLIQLVYNGYISYAHQSANLDTSQSVVWHKLKAIETGSRMQFTLTYNNTIELMRTEYHNYFSTYYKYWIEEINDIIDELNSYDIYNYEIVGHKILNPQGTLVEVTYSNGVVFTINYEKETLIESRVP